MIEEKINSSCIMLAVDLDMPISLGAIFKPRDLVNSGIELDSHITLLYTTGILNKDSVIPDIKRVFANSSLSKNIKDGFDFFKFLESQKELNPKPVFDLFDLSYFERDNSDFVVLRLREDTGIFTILNTLNVGLTKAYNVKSEFSKYRPHVTLAEVKSGLGKEYSENESLELALENSKIRFEDIIFSYGVEDNGKTEYKQWDLTNFYSVDRFFRKEKLRNFLRELE